MNFRNFLGPTGCKLYLSQTAYLAQAGAVRKRAVEVELSKCAVRLQLFEITQKILK